MEGRQEELFEEYDGLRTEALLALHAEGTLTEDAYRVLEAVLASRGVAVPERPTNDGISNGRKRSALWSMRLAAFGLILPIVCLVLDFEPMAFRRVCELCWPSAFFLFAADGKFNLAIYSVSIIVNAFAWAGLGWLIDYGLSGRK